MQTLRVLCTSMLLCFSAVEGQGQIVLNTNDSGVGSLRQTIADASSGDTITFTDTLSGQTIVLTSGQLMVDKHLAIDASDLPDGVAIDGNGSSRIFEFASGTTNVLTGLNLTNGYTSRGGGAILLQNSAVLTISNATLSGNSTHNNDGGGIFNYGRLTLNNVTLSDNSADYNGGGIFNSDSGTLTLNNVTLNGNSANRGGGIHNFLGPLAVNNSTLWENSADTSGGGIYNFLGTLTVTNSIIAGNTAPSDANIYGSFSGTHNLTNSVPLLAPLGDYGGPTQTMPPLPGSPAIDAGGATALATDQRGYPRLSGSAVDIGAVEIQSMIVLNTNDSGVGSLRDALAITESGGTITFTNTLSGQTIVLTSGQLMVDKHLALDASDLSGGVAIDGNANSRIFSFASGITNILMGLTLTNGYTGGNGGAISLYATTLTLNDCTLINNSAKYGGAIYNYIGTLTVNNSTLSNNSVDSYGGAIYNDNGTLTVNNSTLSGNSSGDAAGGIWSYNGTLMVNNTTLHGNSADRGGAIYNYIGTLMLTNTIVAGNTAPLGENIYGSYSGTDNLTSGDPRLSPLGDYGGPTQTMPPLPGSPAIDAGGATALATDQRGYPRIINGTVDIGACESFYVTDSHSSASGFTLEWMTPATGWNSVVKYSTNLVEMPFADLSGSMAYPLNIYTDTVHGAESECFYRVDIRP